MPNKLQRARRSQVPLVEAETPDTQVVGKLIRHQQPPEVESMESKMSEPGSNISHLNGRLSLLYMSYRDLKMWLREVESYLNIDARYGAMEAIKNEFLRIDGRLDRMDARLSEVHKILEEYVKRLDDALKEE